MSIWFLLHMSHRLWCTTENDITLCPSSTHRPSSQTCRIFDFSENDERISTELDRKQVFNVLYPVCAFGSICKQRCPSLFIIGGDLFDFSAAVERISTNIDRKYSTYVLYLVCVFPWQSVEKDGRPWPMNGIDISDSPLHALSGHWQNLTKLRKWSTSSIKFVLFWPIRQQRWLPWPPIGRYIFEFSFVTA